MVNSVIRSKDINEFNQKNRLSVHILKCNADVNLVPNIKCIFTQRLDYNTYVLSLVMVQYSHDHAPVSFFFLHMSRGVACHVVSYATCRHKCFVSIPQVSGLQYVWWQSTWVCTTTQS